VTVRAEETCRLRSSKGQ